MFVEELSEFKSHSKSTAATEANSTPKIHQLLRGVANIECKMQEGKSNFRVREY